MSEKTQEPVDHEVLIVNREQVNIKGVINVDSFDDAEIVLDTDLGPLIVRGEDLRIKQLNLEEGDFIVEGFITGLTYSSGVRGKGRSKGKGGFLDRLLK